MTDDRAVLDARKRTAQAIADIRREVERLPRRERSAELERSLTELRRRVDVNAHWGITPTWPVFGRFEVLGKRAMRILARWYINPIVEQQNSFNIAVVAALYDIEAQIEALRSEMHQRQRDMKPDASN